MATRVLSIDGGGLKGIISAKVLIALEESLKKAAGNEDVRIADHFDLVAGTSTGAILAAMLLYTENGKHKFTAKDCLELYMTYADAIFKKSSIRDLYTLFGYVGPKYSTANFEKILLQYFGYAKLSQLCKPCLITAYDIINKKCMFFNSNDTKKSKHRDFYIRDVILASTAAPTYFPVRKCCNKWGSTPMIDGGVFANNPAMCAVAEASKLTGGVRLEELYMLSLGNVANKKPISFEKAKGWGKIEWIRDLVDIIFDGAEQTVDYQLKTAFASADKSENYLRISAGRTFYGYEVTMDDASPKNLDELCFIGDRVVEKYRDKIDSFTKILVSVAPVVSIG